MSEPVFLKTDIEACLEKIDTLNKVISDLSNENAALRDKLKDYNEDVERCKWQSSEMAKDSTIIIGLHDEIADLKAQLTTYTHGIPIEEADKSKKYLFVTPDGDMLHTVWSKSDVFWTAYHPGEDYWWRPNAGNRVFPLPKPAQEGD